LNGLKFLNGLNDHVVFVSSRLFLIRVDPVKLGGVAPKDSLPVSIPYRRKTFFTIAAAIGPGGVGRREVA
jgi:hypothetical protein